MPQDSSMTISLLKTSRYMHIPQCNVMIIIIIIIIKFYDQSITNYRTENKPEQTSVTCSKKSFLDESPATT